MLSYHNDAKLKAMVVEEMKKHQAQDQFVKNTYGYTMEDGIFKGCAVGCTIDSVNKILGKEYDVSDHEVFEETIGVPEWLADVQDTFFEYLPAGDNSQFAVDFLEAIPVGVNLEPVKYKFGAFLMRENIETVMGLPDLSEELREQVIQAIRGVLNLCEKAVNTGVWDYEEADSARAAAWAVEADSARAAETVAESAAESIAWAAWTIIAESTEKAARAAYFKRYAAELIRLLKETL